MKAIEELSEREKMDYAAKAVGYELLWPTLDDLAPTIKATFKYWNPRSDDGDALRLSIDLDIQIEHVGTASKPTTHVNCWPRGRGDCAAVLSYAEHGGKLAATRKAIFDVAVQVGMSMADSELRGEA